MDPHVVAGGDTVRGQMMGKTVGARLHLGVRTASALGHQVFALTKRVDRVLEQVGEVELHRATLPSAPVALVADRPIK